MGLRGGMVGKTNKLRWNTLNTHIPPSRVYLGEGHGDMGLGGHAGMRTCCRENRKVDRKYTRTRTGDWGTWGVK